MRPDALALTGGTGGRGGTGGIGDRTGATLRALRRMRRGHLRERASDTAFTVYVSVLALVIYGGGVYHKLSALAAEGGARTDQARILVAAAPALVAVHLLALLAVCRDATWRGPVTLSQPAISWLLPLPIDRGRLVRPRFRISLVAAVLGGAVLGVLEALVLGATAGIPVPRLIGAATGAAALLGLLAGGLSGLVVRYPAAAGAVRAASLPVTLAALGLAATADLAWSGRPVGAVTAAAEWSGPWGWAAQPLLAAAGHPVWSGPGQAVAVLALTAAALAGVVAADLTVAAISGLTLRSRSAAMARLAGSAMLLDPRGLALTARAARANARGIRRAGWRLPYPRRAWLAVPWRDATALLRAPSRMAWAAAMTCAAYLLGTLAAGASRGIVALVSVAGALTAGYLAATQLAEPARVDADDPRRAANLPYPFERLALRHAVVPAAVLAVLGLIAAGTTAAVAGSPAGIGLTLLAAPALAAGALVSAYRGPIPGALWLGVETPVGNTAGQQILVWYFGSPVVTVMLLLAPATDLLLGHAAPDRWVRDILWGLGVTGLLLLWASRRAAKIRGY
jgi:hypothetical protein